MSEPWVEDREALTEQIVMMRTMRLNLGILPKNVETIMAGVDVQHGHIYCTVRAYMTDGRSVLIWCGHIEGREERQIGTKLTDLERTKSTRDALDKLWDEVLDRAWEIKDSPDKGKIFLTAVDTADGHTSDVVEAWSYKHYGKVIPVRGAGSSTVKTTTPKFRFSPITRDSKGKEVPGSLKRGLVNSSYYRAIVLAAYKQSMKEAGAWLICNGIPREYAENLCAWQTVEVEVKDKNKRVKEKRLEWRQVSSEDHYLDCEIYCESIHDNISTKRFIKVAQKEDSPVPTPQTKRKSKKKKQLRSRKRIVRSY